MHDKASLDDAMQSAKGLQNGSNRKYGVDESREKGVSKKWIGQIMKNLDKLLILGDDGVKAAPESIGLIWFGIRSVLGATQND